MIKYDDDVNLPVLEDVIAGNMTDDHYTKRFQHHNSKEPVDPLLLLICNENIVMSIYVDKSMERATETVLVADGANCTMTVRNSTVDTRNFCDKTPILHINFTIFHGDKTIIQQNPIVVGSELTSKQNSINFRIVPDCYFGKLHYHLDNTTMYTGTTPANEAIEWLMDDNSGNSQCENPFFIERYALAVMSFSAPFVEITSTDYNRFLQNNNKDNDNNIVPTIEPTDPPTFLLIEDYSDNKNDKDYHTTLTNEPTPSVSILNPIEEYSDDNKHSNYTIPFTTEPTFEPTTTSIPTFEPTTFTPTTTSEPTFDLTFGPTTTLEPTESASTSSPSPTPAISIEDYSDDYYANDSTIASTDEPINKPKKQSTGEPNYNNSWRSSAQQCL